MLKLWKALDESIEYASSFELKRFVVLCRMTRHLNSDKNSNLYNRFYDFNSHAKSIHDSIECGYTWRYHSFFYTRNI